MNRLALMLCLGFVAAPASACENCAKMQALKASNPEMHALHLRAMVEVAPEAEATTKAVASGPWSAAATWSDGVPDAADKALIGEVFEVQQDEQAECLWLRVQGKLLWQDNATLRVGSIVVDSEGEIDWGTTDRRISARVTFRDVDFAAADWTQLGRGLVAMGKVSIFGHDKTDWLKVAENPRKGATALTFAAPPQGWNVGDELIVPGVKPARNYFLGPAPNEIEPLFLKQHERVRITAIAGNVVTFAPPLAYDIHHQVSDGFKLAVGNLTRSIVFESENPAGLRRGQMMFMAQDPIEQVRANFSAKNLGRTTARQHVTDPRLDVNGAVKPPTTANVRGRYPIHDHKQGYFVHTIYDGVVIDGALKWGLSVHQSNTDVINCVSIDAEGANFNTENGLEIGSFKNCLAVGAKGFGRNNWGGIPELRGQVGGRRVIGSGVDQYMVADPLRLEIAAVANDQGFAGPNFWMQGPLFAVTGNEGYGAMNDSFAWVNESLEKDAAGKFLQIPVAILTPEMRAALKVSTGSVPVGAIPITAKDNNAIGGMVAYGLYGQTRSLLPSVITGGVNVNCLGGVFLYPAMEDVTIQGSQFHILPGVLPDAYQSRLTSIGFETYQGVPGTTLRDCTFAGYNIGILASQAQTTILNCRLQNAENIRYQLCPFRNQVYLLEGPEGNFGPPSPARLAEMGNPPTTNITLYPQLTYPPVSRPWQRPGQAKLTLYATADAPAGAEDFPGINGKVVVDKPDHSAEIAALTAERTSLEAERVPHAVRLSEIDARLAAIQARLEEIQ